MLDQLGIESKVLPEATQAAAQKESGNPSRRQKKKVMRMRMGPSFGEETVEFRFLLNYARFYQPVLSPVGQTGTVG